MAQPACRYGDVACHDLQLGRLARRPALGAGDHDRPAGIERPVARRTVGEAAAVVLGFLRQAERTLAEPGGDHDGAAGVAFAVGGLDRPRTGAGELHHFAEAQLDAGLRRSSVSWEAI